VEVFERLIDKFGLPLAGLVALGYFFNRTLWPFIKERIDAAERAFSDQVTEAREARREDQRECLAALAQRDGLMREQTDALKQLTIKIEETRGGRK
jgi:hypothetical protein